MQLCTLIFSKLFSSGGFFFKSIQQFWSPSTSKQCHLQAMPLPHLATFPVLEAPLRSYRDHYHQAASVRRKVYKLGGTTGNMFVPIILNFLSKSSFSFKNRRRLRMIKGKVMLTGLWFQVLSCRCWIYEYIWSIWAYMLWYLEERWRVVRMRLRIHIRFAFYSNSGRGRYSEEGIHSYTG